MFYVLFIKIIFLCSFPIFSVLITKDKPRTNQGRTKDEPTNSQTQKSTFVKIAILFISLIPSSIPPTDDRETIERTPRLQKVTFLKIGILKKVD